MLRIGLKFHSAGMLISCALAGGAATAADWYKGTNAAAPADDWVVAVNGSTTVTTAGSKFADVNATAALANTLNETGPRVRLEALAGTYQYRSTVTGQKVRGEQYEGSGLAGYEWVWRDARLAGYVGLNIQQNALSSRDIGGPDEGASAGLKSVVEFSLKPAEKAMVSGFASYSLNTNAYYAKLKAGYEIADGVYVGPEFTALGSDYFNQWRIGAHLSGFRLGAFQIGLSGGYLQDRVQKAGGYAGIDIRAGI